MHHSWWSEIDEVTWELDGRLLGGTEECDTKSRTETVSRPVASQNSINVLLEFH